jgi:hypothetical protein
MHVAHCKEIHKGGSDKPPLFEHHQDTEHPRANDIVRQH